MGESRRCPECERDLLLEEFPPRHKQPERLDTGQLYRQSRCRLCDGLYNNRRRFFRKLEKEGAARGLRLAPRKGSAYRQLELFSWEPSSEARSWLDAQLADFHAELPAQLDRCRHGIELNRPRLLEPGSRQLLLFSLEPSDDA